jgi:hypothetical protein
VLNAEKTSPFYIFLLLLGGKMKDENVKSTKILSYEINQFTKTLIIRNLLFIVSVIIITKKTQKRYKI